MDLLLNDCCCLNLGAVTNQECVRMTKKKFILIILICSAAAVSCFLYGRYHSYKLLSEVRAEISERQKKLLQLTWIHQHLNSLADPKPIKTFLTSIDLKAPVYSGENEMTMLVLSELAFYYIIKDPANISKCEMILPIIKRNALSVEKLANDKFDLIEYYLLSNMFNLQTGRLSQATSDINKYTELTRPFGKQEDEKYSFYIKACIDNKKLPGRQK